MKNWKGFILAGVVGALIFLVVESVYHKFIK